MASTIDWQALGADDYDEGIKDRQVPTEHRAEYDLGWRLAEREADERAIDDDLEEEGYFDAN